MRLRLEKQPSVGTSVSLAEMWLFVAVVGAWIRGLVWVFPEFWPLNPVLAAIPILGVFVLVACTRYQALTGALIGGGLFVMSVVLMDSSLNWSFVSSWRTGQSMRSAGWLTAEFYCLWLFMRAALFPLVGACIDAHRTGYTRFARWWILGSFYYYIGIVFWSLWTMCNHYWD